MPGAIRIGVIGAGRIGSLHAAIVARRVDGLALAAVQDANPDAAGRVASTLGVGVESNIEGLLARPDVDAVAICSPSDTHVEVIEAAARAGKAIFCEKPISLDLALVDRAIAAVEAAGVPFQVGFNQRFDPGHRAVRDAVASGAIGEVQLVRITSRDPAPPPLAYVRGSGGLFLDMTIHDLDMARYVTGSEVVEVFARGAVLVEPSFAEAGDVDTAVVVLVHASGCITTIDNSRQAAYGYDQRVEAHGSAGMASSENQLVHAAVVRDATGAHAARLQTFFLERYTPSYVAEWEAFRDYVRDGGPSPVSAADGRAPLAVGLAAWRSVREGEPVRL